MSKQREVGNVELILPVPNLIGTRPLCKGRGFARGPLR
jgi:hypothetical protein